MDERVIKQEVFKLKMPRKVLYHTEPSSVSHCCYFTDVAVQSNTSLLSRMFLFCDVLNKLSNLKDYCFP